MYGYTDGSSLISNCTSHSLADPPRGIRRELEPPVWIKFIDRTEESYISLLNKIEQTKSASHILLRDRDHETEIGLCQSLARFLISLLDEVSESDLFFCIDERESSDLIEIHTDGIIRYL